jgi:hypothetical protein
VRSFLYLAERAFSTAPSSIVTPICWAMALVSSFKVAIPLSKTPATEEFAGRGGPGYEIPREFNDLKHDKLVIAAARSQDPDSAGSQFYIRRGQFIFSTTGYTVFGKVVGGADAHLNSSRAM